MVKLYGRPIRRLLIMLTVTAACTYLTMPIRVSAALVAGALCPSGEGWQRLQAQSENRITIEKAPPWERETPRNNGNPRQWLYTIAAGWEDSSRLYVAGEPGLYATADCGISWSMPEDNLSAGSAEPLRWVAALSVTPGGRFYAGTSTSVLVSDDHGVSWRQSADIGRPNGLGVSHSSPDTAFVFGWYNGWTSGSHSAMNAVMRTTDGGQTWKVLGSGQPRKGTLPDGATLVDPRDASVVYAIGHGVLQRSNDGAITFQAYSTYEAEGSGRPRVAFNADGSRLWLVTGSSLQVSTDRGITWSRLADLPFDFPVSISASPLDPNVLFALVRGDEIWAFRDPA